MSRLTVCMHAVCPLLLGAGTLRKISGIRKFGQKILSKMRERVHRKFQDPHFSRVTASQKSGITILAMHLRF